MSSFIPDGGDGMDDEGGGLDDDVFSQVIITDSLFVMFDGGSNENVRRAGGLATRKSSPHCS